MSEYKIGMTGVELETRLNSIPSMKEAITKLEESPPPSIKIESITESTESGGTNIVTFSDGQTLTVRNGAKGEAGYTPVKGVDYFTEADKNAIVAEVVNALGNPSVFGYVDDNNVITVTGQLEEGKYTLKYEMEDGGAVVIGTLDLSSGPAYTNILPQAINASGGVYSDNGWTKDVRLSFSSGAEKAQSGYSCTGFIRYDGKDGKIRIKGFTFDASTDETNFNYIIFYDSSFDAVAKTTLGYKFATNEGDGIYLSSGPLTNAETGTYFRMCMKGYLPDDAVVTLDEPIE